MTIWLTSDWHLGHHNIIEYCHRPFKGIFQMDQAILSRYRELVQPNDIVYHLGDVSLTRPQRVQKLWQLQDLPGIKILLMGNHDRGEPKEWWGMFDTVITRGVALPWGTQRLLLSHFPPLLAPQQRDQRFVKYRPKLAAGWVSVHGHSHEIPRCAPRRVNVCVDAWDFYPVPLKAVLELAEGVR